MALTSRRFERRHPGRPRNGDLKPCPQCGATACEFSERYRFEGKGVAPGWFCDAPNCGFRQLVRGVPAAGPSTRIRGSRDRRARAERQMMKSRSKIARSRKRIAASERRVAKKR